MLPMTFFGWTTDDDDKLIMDWDSDEKILNIWKQVSFLTKGCTSKTGFSTKNANASRMACLVVQDVYANSVKTLKMEFWIKEIENSGRTKDEQFLEMSTVDCALSTLPLLPPLVQVKPSKESIAGLALTDANLSTAVDLLEKRFSRKERITAGHMDVLMSLDAVSSDHHIFELHCLYDKTESTIRSLSAL
uniref:Uncharacterized protein n=1 Tax=Amphimedon queenslandica TaxID=400682 RepID=A0A1X7US99_AMPQE